MFPVVDFCHIEIFFKKAISFTLQQFLGLPHFTRIICSKSTPKGNMLSLVKGKIRECYDYVSVSYTHLRAHETSLHLVCRLLLEKIYPSMYSPEGCAGTGMMGAWVVFSSRRRHTRCREVSWARRCV